MVRCRACGTEKVAWDKTKDDRYYLRDLGQPHGNTCPSKDAEKAPPREPKPPEFAADITDAEKQSLEAAIAAAKLL